jgi:hypothetical protein
VRFLAPIVLLAPCLLGCPNTDAAVFVAASIESPSLTVGMPGPLVSGITGGGFTLDLHLGARASGPSTTTLDPFSIVDTTMKNTLVSLIEVQASSGFTNGSTTVQPDTSPSVPFTIQMKQLGTGMDDTFMQLCMAGQVVIAGGVTDSLMGGTTPTPVYSTPFTPTGCP